MSNGKNYLVFEQIVSHIVSQNGLNLRTKVALCQCWETILMSQIAACFLKNGTGSFCSVLRFCGHLYRASVLAHRWVPITFQLHIFLGIKCSVMFSQTKLDFWNTGLAPTLSPCGLFTNLAWASSQHRFLQSIVVSE